MYKKRELAKIKKKQEDLDLSNTIQDKIFICKKDIPCRNGTFMQGTPVFLDTDGRAGIGKVYDVAQWSPDIVNTFDYTNCYNDYSIKRITKKELHKYFEYSQELTLAYRDRKRMIGKQENDDSNVHHQEHIALTTIVITVITAFILFLIFACLKLNAAWLIGIIVIASIVIMYAWSSVMYAWCSNEKRIKDKADFIKTAKSDLRELAYRGESRAILCPTYKGENYVQRSKERS